MNTGLMLHTLLGLLLLLIPAGALYLLERNEARSERKMLKSFGIAIIRMMVQLLVVCLMVWAFIRVNNPWLLIVWLVAIAAYSGWIVQRRCRNQGDRSRDSLGTSDHGPVPLIPVSAGLFVGTAFCSLWILALALPVRVLDARWLVPVTALLMGHATAMMIRGLSTYVSALKADEQQYEFLRGNGDSHFKALRPFLRRSLLAIVSPTIANLTVLGLTSMPLLLCGIFLGGVTPINAFILMLHMVIGCIAASVLSLAITLFLADKSLFDKFGKMQTK